MVFIPFLIFIFFLFLMTLRKWVGYREALSFFSCFFNFYIFNPSNMRWGISIFYVIVATVLGLLFFKSILSSGFRIKKYRLYGKEILFYCGLTLLVPIFLSGKIQVIDFNADYKELESYLRPLRFSTQNLTQYIYLVIFIFFSNFLSHYKTVTAFRRTLTVYFYGGLVVILSGLLYQIFSTFGSFETVSNIYKLVFGVTDLRLMDRGLWGIRRIYSLAGEASFTSSFLLLQIGVLRYLRLTAQRSSEKFLYHLAFLLNVLLILFSGSTSGIAGLFLLVVFEMLNSGKELWKFFKKKFIWFAVPAIFLFPFAFIAIHSQFVKLMTLDRTSSTLVRFQNLMITVQIFTKSPLFGVGIGSNRSSSMLGWFISNIGLIGMILVFITIYKLYKRLMMNKNKTSLVLLNSYLSYLVVALLSLPFGIFSFGYFIVYTGFVIYLFRYESDNNYLTSHNLENKVLV